MERFVLCAPGMSHIVIDPGHGGHDARGQSTPYGARAGSTWEKDLNLRLAERVAQHLGDTAVLTRSQDANLSLQERASVAKRLGARAFISLHGHADRPGAEVYVHSRATTQSRALADSVQRELAADRACHCATSSRELAVLHPETLGAAVPACMVEMGYDSALAAGNAHALDRIGATIARGVRGFLGASQGYAQGVSHQAPMLHHSRGLDMSLADAIAACTPVINNSGFPERQVNRLNCLMRTVPNMSVDDRYVNGYDYLLRTLGPRLTDDQFNAVIGQMHVRQDIIDAASRTDPDIRTDMDLLDKRILHGIGWLHMMRETQGAALAEALLQLNDWVAARQHDQNSVYFCYGDDQDTYAGRASYGGRRDHRSAWG